MVIKGDIKRSKSVIADPIPHWLLVSFLLLWRKLGERRIHAHFSDALIIRSAFLSFILLVALAEGGILVTLV